MAGLLTFNPSQVARLRDLMKARRAPTSLDGFPLTRWPVLPGDDADVVYEGPAHLVDMSAPERTFGEPEVHDCLAGIVDGQLRLGAPLVRRVTGARPIGFEAVIDDHGHLYAPGPIRDAESMDLAVARRGDYDGFVIARAHEGWQVVGVEPYRPPEFDLTAAFLHNREPGNYGSFIVRQIPQLLLLRRAGISPDAYIVPARTTWLREAFALFDLPMAPIFEVREVVGARFKEVYSVDGYTEGFRRPEDIDDLAALLGRPSGDAPARRLYVSRHLSSPSRPWYRVLRNEDEIHDLVARAGFEIMYPEALSLAEQVGMFHAAGAVLGPAGSGVFNASFSRPGIRVVELDSYTATLRLHSRLFSSSGMRYAYAFGRFAGGMGSRPDAGIKGRSFAPWEMPVNVVEEVLDWLL